VNILYLVVLEWCLGVGWVLLFLSPLIICSSIPLDGVVLESPLDARGDTVCSKDESDIVTGYLLLCFRGQCLLIFSSSTISLAWAFLFF